MRAMTIPELMRVAVGVMLNLIAWKQIRIFGDPAFSSITAVVSQTCRRRCSPALMR
jgi:hypothetical protein